MIREIVAELGAKIDIEDDGTIKIAAAKREAIEAALARIRGITSEPEVGQVYKGKVVKIMEFGAFVNFFGAKDGLVHISQLTQGRPADRAGGRQGGPGGVGQAAGLRRPRQGAPVHEDRRPGRPARRSPAPRASPGGAAPPRAPAPPRPRATARAAASAGESCEVESGDKGSLWRPFFFARSRLRRGRPAPFPVAAAYRRRALCGPLGVELCTRAGRHGAGRASAKAIRQRRYTCGSVMRQ